MRLVGFLVLAMARCVGGYCPSRCYCGETDTIWCRGDINPFKLPFPPNADISFLDWQRCLIPRVEIGIFDVFSNLTNIDLRGQLIEFECESLTLIPKCISVQADCHFKSSFVSHEVTTTKFDLTSEPITLNTERVPGDSTLSYSNPVNLTTPSHSHRRCHYESRCHYF